VVPLPDIRGREQILKVHMKKVPISKDVDPSLIARGTPGFSGADLANLVNEAALVAARTAKKLVGMEQMEFAKDKVMMGSERRSMVMSEEEKLKTAYHESGHAIVGRSLKEHDPVYKVTIIPRGRALGITMFLPEEDKYSYSHQSILDRICGLYGGRVAEELIYGEKGVTTGASNDIERATELAHNMVTKWGLSEKLGPVKYGDENDEPFLGRSAGTSKQGISDQTASEIDKEVKEILGNCYKTAKEVLENNIDALHKMSQALMDYETLDADQIDDIMAGGEPRAPKSTEEPPSKGSKESSVGDAAEQN
jgi:cell division protease FtsH